MHYFVITVQNQEESLPQRNYNSRLRYLICNWFQKEVAASMFKEPRNNYVIKLAYFLPPGSVFITTAKMPISWSGYQIYRRKLNFPNN
jgi:hypothetical protein